MFKSVLVANRGEIACRVFRTARAMGVRTIAVYSEADADALHVREADEAVLIGPAAARESYLDAAKVLAAARETGAEAIHPGYGFLSENADFAEAVMAAGLVWIGPPPAAIRAMGLKDAAKTLMDTAGVPVTPGYLGEDQSLERLQKEADAIGYPVLIKAVAGGGGKGMKKVERSADFAAGLAGAQREGEASFGDPRVLIEKYITRPRHIEVQVFGDSQGNVVHLYERDCSLQRRHQKVIEEAPAPGMDEETRKAVTDAAVRAAKAVNYVGAGTVEFIADASEGLKPDRIWFMEMNTRLQVEHPVTEAVTGVDLVEWQFRVAAGEPLPLQQDEIQLDGWAMEARLYAEDPDNGFLPSIGRLDHFQLPDDLRVDTGVEQGGEVSQHYDPMIAKLIVHENTREAAAARLADACCEVEVWPVRTNAAFLARCLDHPRFVSGDVDTGFIGAEEETLASVDLTEEVIQEAGNLLWRARSVDPDDVWDSEYGAPGFRLNGPAVLRHTFFVDGVSQQADYQHSHPVVGYGPEIDGGFVIFYNGEAHTASRHAPRGAAAEGGDGSLRAPMPGKIVAVSAEPGQSVAKGQSIVVLEAMKMEHALTAPFDGVVGELGVAVGDQVTDGAVLAVITASEGAA
ncbi:MAG: acetyl/propionyl/methylcrotonyl-CoA carboxylase subunit alpha [Brevundimonas sp.]|uniref:acetyl/propionyl/methylcrotonyl-CoA carboxylase subunit alpha n=1 Tax=Brevundimonas sp. TaxID=1871086 RepID=UPI00391CBB0A